MQKLHPIPALAVGLAFMIAPSIHAADPALPALTKAMEQFIDSGEIAGAVTVVADGDSMLHFQASGWADIEAKGKLETDSIFWIASMTKPVTGTAVMMLQEQGLLSLDDSVSKYLPEFKDLKDAEGNEVTITIQQCLTHTSGMSDLPREVEQQVKTLAELTSLAAALPVNFPPGSKWQYCQSSINTAARIVEVISGKSFPDFLEERLFTPLGMKDTTFYPSEDQLTRLAGTYKKAEDGKLEKTGIAFLGGKPLTSTDRYPRANGGLFSTAADYTRFAQMILSGGELDGRRYLKPESVKHMTSVLTGEIETGFTPGNAWGLGWCITPEPQGVSAALSPGSFGHGGAYGTQAWIDPSKERIHLLFIQRSDIGNSDGSEIRRAFHDAAVK